MGTLGIPAGTLAGTSAGIQMGTVPLPFGGTFPELLEEGTTGGTGGGTTFSEPLGCVLGLDFLGNFFFFERHPNHSRITNTTIITPRSTKYRDEDFFLGISTAVTLMVTCWLIVP